MTKEELRIILSEHIKREGFIRLVGGALGEMLGCNAYEEKTTREGMWLTKYYGVSYCWKGITDNDIINRVTTVKKVFMEGVDFLFKNKYLIPIILIFRNRFIKNAITSFAIIYECEGGLKSKCLKLEQFCPFCQELIKAGLRLAGNNKEIEDLIFCFAMFLQFSTGYRFRFQDIFGELDKDNFKKSPIEEIWRLKKIMLQREKCVNEKLPRLFSILILLMMFKKYRKIICDFVNELDIEKIKFDEDDWYFCLRRVSYDPQGIPLEERLREVERIDLEQDNLILGI